MRYVPHSLHEFPCVHWIGRRYGEEYLRSYDVGEGVLVCAGDEVKMRVDCQGNGLTLDFDDQDTRVRAIASALTINLGISLCTLFHGDLPLHAASAEVDGNLIGILAPSGTGKSTLLWRLLDAGARFACDDVLPVQVTQEGVQAFPSMTLPAKLSKQALERRGRDWRQYAETLPGEEEFWIPMPPECRLLQPRPLAALFFLQPFRHPEVPGQITVRQHTEGAALALLLANTQGLWTAQSNLDVQRLYVQGAALAQAVPLYTLEYHRRVASLPGLEQTIHELLHSGGQHPERS